MRWYWEEAYDMNASNNKQAFAEGDTANARRRTTKLVPVACAARPEDHPTRPTLGRCLVCIVELYAHRPDPPQTSACESGANRPPNSMAGQLSAINKPPLGRVGAAPDEKQQQPPGPSHRFKFQYGDQVIPRPGRRRNSPAWLLLERTRQDWNNFKMKQKTSPP